MGSLTKEQVKEAVKFTKAHPIPQFYVKISWWQFIWYKLTGKTVKIVKVVRNG